MSDLRPQAVKIEIGGKEYGLLFNLNAIDEIQDKLDLPLSELYGALRDERKVFKVLKVMLTALINQAMDEEESKEPRVTADFIGRKIKIGDIANLRGKVTMAFAESVPSEDDAPNVESE